MSKKQFLVSFFFLYCLLIVINGIFIYYNITEELFSVYYVTLLWYGVMFPFYLIFLYYLFFGKLRMSSTYMTLTKFVVIAVTLFLSIVLLNSISYDYAYLYKHSILYGPFFDKAPARAFGSGSCDTLPTKGFLEMSGYYIDPKFDRDIENIENKNSEVTLLAIKVKAVFLAFHINLAGNFVCSYSAL